MDEALECAKNLLPDFAQVYSTYIAKICLQIRTEFIGQTNNLLLLHVVKLAEISRNY